MLIDELVNFSDQKYTAYGCNCGNDKCNHPSGNCTGECYDCLYQIHFPERFSEPKKKIYDCEKMLHHYVCQNSHTYASEILKAFNLRKETLLEFENFKLLSIACGACPDLIALEKFCVDNQLSKKIAFRGYDINPIWGTIHSAIKDYCDNHNIQRSFFVKDVLSCFKTDTAERANIIVISYLISYLYNTEQTHLIKSFFEDITDNVIMKKKNGEKTLIIINDVNSNRRGRDYFNELRRVIKKRGGKIKSGFKYFDTGNLNVFQKIGTPYKSNECLFEIPHQIQEKYHTYSSHNRKTIQLILEVESNDN